MDAPPGRNVTDLLHAWSGGDLGALEELVPIVYADLKRRASRMLRRERRGRTLQTTGLVHEAYLLLQRQHRVSWNDRSHFFAVSARLMRRILVDRARARRAAKRGGPSLVLVADTTGPAAEPEMDLLDLDRALEELAALDDRQARMVELRYFGGLSLDEVAEAMGTSKATVKRDWTAARAWLYGRLKGSPGDGAPGRTA